MIKLPTVFILGAGASWYFDFPLGSTLLHQIELSLSNRADSVYQMLVQQLNHSESEIEDLLFAIRASSANSIDEIYARNPRIRKIGKSATFLILAQYELEEMLWRRDYEFEGQSDHEKSKPNWLKTIFRKMQDECFDLDTWQTNNVAFVTFNYDRSVEKSLELELKSMFPFADEETLKTALERTPVLHIYGQLGYLPWQVGDTLQHNALREYSPQNLDRETVYNSRDSISFFQESELPERTFHLIQRHFAAAKNIFFLGFAYNPINMKKLPFSSASPNTHIKGTAFQESDFVRNRALEIVIDASQKKNQLSLDSFDARIEHFLAAELPQLE